MASRSTVGAARPDAFDAAVEAAQPDPDVRYGITQAGRDAWRRYEAERNTFGPWPKLSEVLDAREIELAGLVDFGRTDREIAEAWHVHPSTIVRAVVTLRRKLGATCRADIGCQLNALLTR
jgi:DNA-binding NarL/FixJ family response regulator